MTDPVNVVAYLRDSGGSEQDLSVDQQRAEVEKWCAAHGFVLTRVFADRATLGSTVVGRAAFQEMIRHFHGADQRESAVVLWKYSRFSRDLDDAQFYKADLRRRGITIHSINDNIPDTTDGRLFENLIDWMNARFLDDLSTDVKRGLHHLLEYYGALPGTPPRGFKREPVIIGSRRDGTPHTACRWVPDPELWETCRRAFLLRASGAPIKQIHQETRLFSNRTSYSAFFRNRLYLGELHYGEKVIAGYVEPMISLEVWDAVQRLNRTNSKENDPMRSGRHPRRVASSYLLSGLLHCLKCGSLMSGKTVTDRKGYRMRYYQCTGAHAQMKCDARRIPANIIEHLVEKSLKEYILDPDAIAERDREQRLALSGSRDQFAAERKRLNGQINDTRKRIDNLVEKISSDPAAPRSLISALKDLEQREGLLLDELARVKSMENQEPVFVPTAAVAAQLAERFHEKWNSQRLEDQREIVRALVTRVTAERDGNLVRGMIYFLNPNEEDIKKEPSPGDEDSLPTSRCLHGASSHRQTYVIPYTIDIKYTRALKHHQQYQKDSTGSP